MSDKTLEDIPNMMRKYNDRVNDQTWSLFFLLRCKYDKYEHIKYDNITMKYDKNMITLNMITLRCKYYKYDNIHLCD